MWDALRIFERKAEEDPRVLTGIIRTDEETFCSKHRKLVLNICCQMHRIGFDLFLHYIFAEPENTLQNTCFVFFCFSCQVQVQFPTGSVLCIFNEEQSVL